MSLQTESRDASAALFEFMLKSNNFIAYSRFMNFDYLMAIETQIKLFWFCKCCGVWFIPTSHGYVINLGICTVSLNTNCDAMWWCNFCNLQVKNIIFPSICWEESLLCYNLLMNNHSYHWQIFDYNYHYKKVILWP